MAAFDPPKSFSASAHEYRLRGKCGAGAYGQVFVYKEVERDHLVAIKFVSNFDPARDIVADDVSSPHVLRPECVEAFGDKTVVVQPYIKGCNGLEYINALRRRDPAGMERPALAGGIEVARSLLGALYACQSEGIRHRDIKLTNFMIGRNGSQKFIGLIDFGIAAYDNEDSVKAAASHFYDHPDYFSGEGKGFGGLNHDLYRAVLTACAFLVGRPPAKDLHGEQRRVDHAEIINGAAALLDGTVGGEIRKFLDATDPSNWPSPLELLSHLGTSWYPRKDKRAKRAETLICNDAEKLARPIEPISEPRPPAPPRPTPPEPSPSRREADSREELSPRLPGAKQGVGSFGVVLLLILLLAALTYLAT